MHTVTSKRGSVETHSEDAGTCRYCASLREWAEYMLKLFGRHDKWVRANVMPVLDSLPPRAAPEKP